MTANRTLRQLAASTAVAMAFSPLANAADALHPLLNPATGAPAYSFKLSETLVKVTGDNAASLRTKGFVVELEKALQEPSEKIRIVDYPKPVSANMLRITAVVPPKGFEALDIPVCAERDNKVVGTWNITTDKGNVNPAPWTGARESETPTSAACKAFILASRDAISQKLASGTPAQPPPVAKVATAEQAKQVVYPNFGTTVMGKRPEAPATN